MTAGPYADAAGLVERSAAAYAAAVPVTPGDEGFSGRRAWPGGSARIWPHRWRGCGPC